MFNILKAFHTLQRTNFPNVHSSYPNLCTLYTYRSYTMCIVPTYPMYAEQVLHNVHSSNLAYVQVPHNLKSLYMAYVRVLNKVHSSYLAYVQIPFPLNVQSSYTWPMNRSHTMCRCSALWYKGHVYKPRPENINTNAPRFLKQVKNNTDITLDVVFSRFKGFRSQ